MLHSPTQLSHSVFASAHALLSISYIRYIARLAAEIFYVHCFYLSDFQLAEIL